MPEEDRKPRLIPTVTTYTYIHSTGTINDVTISMNNVPGGTTGVEDIICTYYYDVGVAFDYNVPNFGELWQ